MTQPEDGHRSVSLGWYRSIPLRAVRPAASGQRARPGPPPPRRRGTGILVPARLLMCAFLIALTVICALSAATTGVDRHSISPSSNSMLAPVGTRSSSGLQHEIAGDVVPASGWTRLEPTSHPSGRFGAGLVYDAADGYVLLFGGGVAGGVGTPSNYSATRCFNDSWTFKAGEWTNLSIPGPPPACDVSMAYDAAAGYVVAYLATGGTQVGYLNETWKFSDGSWSELLIPNPTFGTATMTYDASLGVVLLYDSTTGPSGAYLAETWEFSGGAWAQVATQSTPTTLSPADLTYDAAENYAVLIAPPSQAGLTGPQNATWAFSGTDWFQLESLPMNLAFQGPPGVAFDVRDGAVVLFGGPWVSESNKSGASGSYQNETWLLSGGSWTHSLIGGPSGRIFPSMIFDAADGYLLLFGGLEVVEADSVAHEWFQSDSWIYTPPPYGIVISVAASPSEICSVAAPNCGAGAHEGRVNISVAIVPVAGDESWGVDTGAGSVEYGPYYWTVAPSLTFVGWQGVSPSANLDPSSACQAGGEPRPTCEVTPVISGSASGSEELSWNWSTPASAGVFEQGDSWHLAFNVQAIGPPYGVVPVDSCTTASCIAAHDDPRATGASAVSLSPFGNGTFVADSLPLAEVTVLPPLTGNPPPPAGLPPPAPPTVGSPLPVGTPAVPVPVAGPVVVTTTVASGGAGLSLAVAGAGALGAGVTRVALTRPAHRLRVASRVSAVARQPDRVRGVE
jgi:hypothetical protein